MPRDIGLYLEDMLEAAHRITDYLQGVDRSGFAEDPRTIDAVVRNLEEVRQRAPEVDWRKIAGMRDVLAHTYFAIDLDIAWDAATTKVPTLVEPIRRLLRDLAPG